MSPFLRACSIILLMQAAGADAKMSKNMQAKMSKDEQAIKPTTGSSLLLKEVEQMAQSDKSPNMDAIKEIKRIIDEQLLPDLNAEHQASVVDTQNKHQAITVCNDQVGQRNQNIATTTEVAVETARQGNSVCRLSEKSMHEHNLTSGSRCGQLGTFLHSLSDPANLPSDRLRAGMVQYVEDLTNTPMCEGPRVRSLSDDCAEAEAELATKKQDCDLKQATFESDFCTWRTALVLSCDDHTTCYDTALSTYNDHVTQTTSLIDTRFRVEFKTLTKIKCYTDVWLNKETTSEVDADAFDHCNALEPNTDSMNIVFAAAPAKALCSLVAVEHYPGTPGFVTTEYHTFNAFIENPIACIGPGASAPSDAGSSGSMLAKSSASPRTAAELDAAGSMIETGNRKTVMRRQKNEESVAFQFNSQGAVDRTTSKPYNMEDLSEMDVNALYGLLKNVGTSTSIKAGLAKLIMEQQGTA